MMKIFGIGNILLGDDGVGVRVVEKIKEERTFGETPINKEEITTKDFELMEIILQAKLIVDWIKLI